jgi:Zn-finger protein
MVKNEQNFCLLYKENKKCHNLENLNCYFCGCPHFRINDIESFCNINSKDGNKIKAKDGFIHQDCTKCTIPHHEKYITKYFDNIF